MTIPQQPIDGNKWPVTNTMEPSGATQKINSAGSSTQSTAFSTDTIIRVVSDADCNFAIGTNPTATTSTAFLPSKSGEQMLIKAGNKIAVIGTVNLYVTTYV